MMAGTGAATCWFTRDKKLAFPLYIGFGYQFKASKWMMLIGPGISVKL